MSRPVRIWCARCGSEDPCGCAAEAARPAVSRLLETVQLARALGDGRVTAETLALASATLREVPS